MFKINDKDTRTTFEHFFHFFSSFSFVDFEQVNVWWDNDMIFTLCKGSSSNFTSNIERIYTAQKMKFSIKEFFSKWSHLLKKSLMKNFFLQLSELINLYSP